MICLTPESVVESLTTQLSRMWLNVRLLVPGVSSLDVSLAMPGGVGVLWVDWQSGVWSPTSIQNGALTFCCRLEAPLCPGFLGRTQARLSVRLPSIPLDGLCVMNGAEHGSRVPHQSPWRVLLKHCRGSEFLVGLMVYLATQCQGRPMLCAGGTC